MESRFGTQVGISYDAEEHGLREVRWYDLPPGGWVTLATHPHVPRPTGIKALCERYSSSDKIQSINLNDI